jgi:hypothetical protein
VGGGDCKASEKGAQEWDFINDDRFALDRRGVHLQSEISGENNCHRKLANHFIYYYY